MKDLPVRHYGRSSYQPKTNRHRGMWDMVRIVAQFTNRLTPSQLTPALTQEQATAALGQLFRRGELIRIRKGYAVGNGRHIEPVYMAKSK